VRTPRLVSALALPLTLPLPNPDPNSNYWPCLWPGAHAEGAAAGGALRAFWAFVREGAAAEREWADAVFATGGALAGSVFAEALEAPQ
jgi:hypothetical protein